MERPLVALQCEPAIVVKRVYAAPILPCCNSSSPKPLSRRYSADVSPPLSCIPFAATASPTRRRSSSRSRSKPKDVQKSGDAISHIGGSIQLAYLQQQRQRAPQIGQFLLYQRTYLLRVSEVFIGRGSVPSQSSAACSVHARLRSSAPSWLRR